MRLLVFLHGTALMHPGAVGRTRQERVAQVRAAQEPTLHDYDAYVPVGNVVAKLRHWQHQGAQIAYPQIRPDRRSRIKSIVVPEFGGIDHLPDSLQDLLAFNPD